MDSNAALRNSRTLLSDPARESMKSARRIIGHDDAIQETVHLQRQFRILWSDRLASSPVDLTQILRTLTKKRSPLF